MKTKLILKAIAATTLVWGLAPTAQAAEQQGVQCPSGYAASITNDSKKLVCSTVRTYEAASVCVVPNHTTRDNQGADRCLAGVIGKDLPSTPLLIGIGLPPASQFQRVINQTGPDVFRATVTEYAFPTGTLIPYVGNPANGVSCPSGYDGDPRFGGRGIRCDKWDGPQVVADCDFGWTWLKDHLGREDRCLGLNFNPNDTDGGPTKPQGMTKVQHDVDRARGDVSWHLDKNGSARDAWRRKIYKFPG